MPQVCKLLSSLASGRAIVLYKLHKLLNAKRADDKELYYEIYFQISILILFWKYQVFEGVKQQTAYLPTQI